MRSGWVSSVRRGHAGAGELGGGVSEKSGGGGGGRRAMYRVTRAQAIAGAEADIISRHSGGKHQQQQRQR